MEGARDIGEHDNEKEVEEIFYAQRKELRNCINLAFVEREDICVISTPGRNNNLHIILQARERRSPSVVYIMYPSFVLYITKVDSLGIYKIEESVFPTKTYTTVIELVMLFLIVASHSCMW